MEEYMLYTYIKEHFGYNPDGTFQRRDRKNSSGSYDKDGYLIMKIKGRQYKAHRLVYLWHHGRFPNGEIDHINRKRDDNRIENLRCVSRQENLANTTIKPNKETGVVGVYIDKTPGLKKKYATRLGGVSFRFYSIEDALKKRQEYYKHT